MSSTEVTEAVTKLQHLSQERAGKVLSLIDDLVELEVLEDVADLKDAHEALAEIKTDKNRPTIPYDQLRRELGLDR